MRQVFYIYLLPRNSTIAKEIDPYIGKVISDRSKNFWRLMRKWILCILLSVRYGDGIITNTKVIQESTTDDPVGPCSLD